MIGFSVESDWSRKWGELSGPIKARIDPCQLHTVLNDEDRDIENDEDDKCDSQLNVGWYRFLNKPGIRMPTSCPPTDSRCGTAWPGWLGGVHPTVEDGIVTRAVHFRRRTDCKELTVHDIEVKNCSSFFVYLLRPTGIKKWCAFVKL
ncbi:hypothetical protein pdam_00015467 [Pocillopora damicornis]|uniref:UMOD/GP2/OIT3-like D8C domain-containing protein n=1 Tax=Pocillopora damicornis TaxID=46731 RepID=A0A3M6UHQ3_POCDA|nr:hypothetical protein pdam_00015467 [Pocillopora damicornis]